MTASANNLPKGINKVLNYPDTWVWRDTMFTKYELATWIENPRHLLKSLADIKNCAQGVGNQNSVNTVTLQ
jgi:hypothetical protein